MSCLVPWNVANVCLVLQIAVKTHVRNFSPSSILWSLRGFILRAFGNHFGALGTTWAPSVKAVDMMLLSLGKAWAVF